MLVVCVGSLAGNLVAQLNKVFGELAKTANDHCKILPPNTKIHQFKASSVLRGSLASKVARSRRWRLDFNIKQILCPLVAFRPCAFNRASGIGCASEVAYI